MKRIISGICTTKQILVLCQESKNKFLTEKFVEIWFFILISN